MSKCLPLRFPCGRGDSRQHLDIIPNEAIWKVFQAHSMIYSVLQRIMHEASELMWGIIWECVRSVQNPYLFRSCQCLIAYRLHVFDKATVDHDRRGLDMCAGCMNSLSVVIAVREWLTTAILNHSGNCWSECNANVIKLGQLQVLFAPWGLVSALATNPSLRRLQAPKAKELRNLAKENLQILLWRFLDYRWW